MEYFQEFAAVAGVLTGLGGLLWWLRRRGWAGAFRGEDGNWSAWSGCP